MAFLKLHRTSGPAEAVQAPNVDVERNSESTEVGSRSSIRKSMNSARVSARDADDGSQKSIDYTPPIERNGDGTSPANNLQVAGAPTEYRTYKRRWFGVVGIAIINILAAMNWLLFVTSELDARSLHRLS